MSLVRRSSGGVRSGPVRLTLSDPRNHRIAESPNRRIAHCDRIPNREALPRDSARFDQPCESRAERRARLLRCTGPVLRVLFQESDCLPSRLISQVSWIGRDNFLSACRRQNLTHPLLRLHLGAMWSQCGLGRSLLHRARLMKAAVGLLG